MIIFCYSQSTANDAQILKPFNFILFIFKSLQESETPF